MEAAEPQLECAIIESIHNYALVAHYLHRVLDSNMRHRPLIRVMAMHLTLLPISALVVNPHNDRHGDLSSESAAISWLLSRRESHMRNLARDIVAQGGVYEPPLVAEEGSASYVVYDGNHRVTCLKLIGNPQAAPTQELQRFFADVRAKWQGTFPDLIQCQIETDRERIDEILYRRHTGSQSGVGQSHWDDAAKDNFIARTGRKSGRNVAEGIEKKLIATGYIATEGDLPRSNLNRLLSSEDLRALVGLSFADGKLRFTATPEKVLAALDRIASDLMSKKLVLGHIWNNDGKRSYLAELDELGALPRKEDELRVPVAFEEASPQKRMQLRQKPVPTGPRSTLIPYDLDRRIAWSPEMVRLRDIWQELQQLAIERYPNAVAVSLRVLLELSVDLYLRAERVHDMTEGDLLRKKVARVASHLEAVGVISEKYRKEVQRFASGEDLISASSMHRYIHSLTYSPSPRHLTAIWDTLSEFLVACLRASGNQKEAA